MYTFKMQNYQIILKNAQFFVVHSQFLASLLFIYQKANNASIIISRHCLPYMHLFNLY